MLTSHSSVYNLRLKVAQPDEKASPPTPPAAEAARSKHTLSLSPSTKAQTKSAAIEDQESDGALGDDNAEDEEELEEYITGECLFCPEFFDGLEPSLTHMTTSHGFTVPFQDCLAVDIETVLDYMHFVINGYRECICCGTQRGSVAAVQQHMFAKGHCRFDINDETEEFYEMPKEDNFILNQTQEEGNATIRLPSGKTISHRTIQEAKEPKPRQVRQNPFLEAITSGSATTSNTERQNSQRSTNETSQSSSQPTNFTQELAARDDRREDGDQRMVRSSEAILAAQLSRLVIRSEMAQMRVESKKKAKMERKNNKILQQHFKLDAGDSRAGRQFCC